MEIYNRKKLRYKNYNYSNSGVYFLTICTNERKRILSTLVGDGAHDVPKIELSEIGKIVEKYILSSEKMKDVYIDKYVIMPDHIHIIVVIKHNLNIIPDNKKGTSKAPSPTNQIIPRFVSTLKRLCNKEIGENIFQRSYIEHIIRDEDDYKTRVKYIYENPLKWYYNNH